jgi:hypothetical protein
MLVRQPFREDSTLTLKEIERPEEHLKLAKRISETIKTVVTHS